MRGIMHRYEDGIKMDPYRHLRFKVLIAVKIHILIFWIVRTHRLIESY
jgi:hypothetical protein